MKTNQRALCFLELEPEATAFLDHCKKEHLDPNSFVIVALSLEVQVILNAHNVKFATTLDFFDNDGHRDVMHHLHDFQTRFEQILNLNIEDDVICKTYEDSAIYVAQYYINYFLFLTYVVDAAIKKIRPDSVYTFSSIPDIKFWEGGRIPPHIQGDEFYASQIVGAYCQRWNINQKKLALICKEEEKIPKAAIASGWWHFINRQCNYFWMYWANRSSLVLFLGGGGTNGNAISQVLKSRKDLRVVNFLDGAGFKGCLINIRNILFKHSNIIVFQPDVFLPTSNRTTKQEQFLESRLNNPYQKFSKKSFEYRGINFFHIFEKKINRQLWPYLKSLASRVGHRLGILEKLNIKFVVATGAREENFAIGEWARWREKPFVMVAHGTAIAPKNELEKIENANLGRSLLLSPVATVGALQTPTEVLHTDYFKPNCKRIKCGPILFTDWEIDKTQRVETYASSSKHTITIMLGSSYKSRDTMRFWAMETPDEYLSTCCDLVQVVNEMDDSIRLLIRFHNKLKMSPEDFRSLLPACDRLDIERGGRFLDSLKKSDLVVNFSSSSIEEALQNNVPVLLYDPWKRYQHCRAQVVDDPKGIEPSAVYYLNERAKLKVALEKIVQNHLLSNSNHTALFSSYQFPKSYIENFKNVFF